MAKISELRKKYPQYEDLSDQEFADKYHKKYYSDMPKEDYYSKIGISPQTKPGHEEPSSILQDLAGNAAGAIPDLASGLMQLPSEAYGAITHPLRTAKNIPIGLAEGLAGAYNLPGNITQYLSKKGYLPEIAGKAAKAMHFPTEKIEEKLGLLPEEPGESLTRALSGFGILGKAGRFGEASKLKRAGLGAAYAGGQGENPVTGAIAALIPSLIKGGQKGYEYIKEPQKAINATEDTLHHIKNLLSENEDATKSEKTNISKFVNQNQESLTNKQNNFESQLPEIFPIKPKSETRMNLSTTTNEAVKNLDQDFSKRYGQFNQDFGHIPVEKPFNAHETKLNGLKNVSHTTKNMGYDVSNDSLEYTDSNGDTTKITFPADKSSVQNYVDFSRELRDAAWDASKASKNATHGEKQELRKTSNALRQLQGQAEQKIKETIGEEAFNQFKGIQTDYSQLMGPVKTEPALFNAAYKKKISDKLHDTLLQPANEHIRNYLYNSPEFVNAIREHMMQGNKHPLSQGPQLNPAAIDYDIQHLLTNNQKSALNESSILKRSQNHLNAISKYIKNPETITSKQEQNIRQFHPEMNEYLNNLMTRNEFKGNLEKQQKMLEEQKRELTKKRNKRYIKAGIGGALASTALPYSLSRLIKKIL